MRKETETVQKLPGILLMRMLTGYTDPTVFKRRLSR